MEKTNFGESLTIIRSALQRGDVARLAKVAGVSEVTFRNTFTRAEAIELTDGERRALNVCMEDERIKQRIAEAKRIETEATKLASTK